MALGESSNSAVLPRADALRWMRVWTIDGGPAESLRGVCGIEPVLATGLVLKEPTILGPGEFSGERDGKETKDLAELGVTSDCLRDLERTVPGRWEVELVDAMEDLRSGR